MTNQHEALRHLAPRFVIAIGRAAGCRGRGAVCTTTTAAASGHAQARARAFDPELLAQRRFDSLSRPGARMTFLAQPLAPAEAGGISTVQLGAATCVFLTTDTEHRLSAPAPRAWTRNAVWCGRRWRTSASLPYMDRGVLVVESRRRCRCRPRTFCEHEQIHFALFEIAARRLNRRVEWLTDQIQTVSSNRQAAVDQLHRRIDTEIDRAMAGIVRRSDELDDETSRIVRQDRQNWWWRLVNNELAQLDPPVRQQ